MKGLWMWFLVFSIFSSHSAQTSEHQDLAIIKSIDDFDHPPYYDEASAHNLPPKYHLKLIELIDYYRFTVISENRARDLFSELERHPRARMRVAGGKCSYRRSYIQGYLKKLNILSGRLLIQCPYNNGRLRLIDQVTGRRYTFSNFHDTNIVAVQDNSERGYHVMDIQFQNKPLPLSEYLGQIETFQRIKPSSRRSSSDRGYCYWSVK